MRKKIRKQIFFFPIVLLLVSGCSDSPNSEKTQQLVNLACTDAAKLKSTASYIDRIILFDRIQKNFLLASQLANDAELLSYSVMAGSKKMYLANLDPDYLELIFDYCDKP